MPHQEHQNTPDGSSPDSSGVITSFDELAKGLATGAVSRRKALRWMGSALVGAALASVPGGLGPTMMTTTVAAQRRLAAETGA